MQVEESYHQQSMELHLQEIDVLGHPHRPLRLRAAEKPYNCGGCKEIIIVSKSCYHCDHKDRKGQKCEFYLHEECVPPPTDTPFYLGLIKCDLTFHREDPPIGKTMVCDACGKDVKVWFYKGGSKGKSYYLHPCCAKLDFNLSNVNLENIVFDLKERTELVCLKCKNKDCHSKDFRSWVYVSRCGKYCFHVSCMKETADKWTEEEGNNLPLISYDRGREQQRSTTREGKAGDQDLGNCDQIVHRRDLYHLWDNYLSCLTVCFMDKQEMVDHGIIKYQNE